MKKTKDDGFSGYLFTFKAEEWDEFEDFRRKWSRDNNATEMWSSGKSKSIPKDAPIFVLKQGKHPTGIIAIGATASENQARKFRNGKTRKLVRGRGNRLRFQSFLNPEVDRIVDITDLPRKYWASRASGVGLAPRIFNEITRRWNDLLGKRATEYRGTPMQETQDEVGEYQPSTKDTRLSAKRQINERRGQPEFRRKLISNYGAKCAISGCDVIQLLEAAHIKPYRGANDNNVRNGLLLRADLHTLFDLALLCIDPRTKRVRVHPDLKKSDYDGFDGMRLASGRIAPSDEALDIRWQTFKIKCR